ncbi:MAG: NfeD family protein [Desulfuromonadaceae bacterium]|nr:NfeD family protein [Desulfuromonas sp.]MDY0185336.1 NfeD family protein [Desulfuromonadaceae bacterium]
MDWLTEPWLLWLLAAGVFVVVELLTPGFIVIFFGIGALVVSILLLIFNFGLTAQVWSFLLISVASLVILRKTLVGLFQGREEVDQLDDTPTGTALVVKEIKPGIDGRVSFRGSFWPAQAEQHFNVDDTVLVVGYAAGIKTILKVVKPDQGESA